MALQAGATSVPAVNRSRGGPRSKKGARTRARLLEAAKEVFEEHGFLDARVTDIAERAGVSHGSFYHYFESKEQIFREVAALVDEQLSEPLGSVIMARSPESPAERLAKAIRRHFESYREFARIMGVIEQVSRYDEHVGAVRTSRHKVYREEVAESIRRLQRRGMADPALDPEVAAAALGAMTSRFAEMWLAQGIFTCDFDTAVEQVTRVFVNALGIRDAGPVRRLRAGQP